MAVRGGDMSAMRPPNRSGCRLPAWVGPSCHAELVVFRIEHDDVAELFAVGFLAHGCRPSVDQLGRLGSDALLALGRIPGGSPAARMSMCIRFLAVLGSGTRRNRPGR